jgi:hypothetical protein
MGLILDWAVDITSRLEEFGVSSRDMCRLRGARQCIFPTGSNTLEERVWELLEAGRSHDALRIYLFITNGDPSLAGGHL